jgi:large repetitive protein
MLAPLPPRPSAHLLSLLLALALLLTPAHGQARPSANPQADRPPAQTPQQAAGPVGVTKSDALLVDQDGDGQASPGDTLRYTVALSNTTASDLAAVTVSDTLDPNTTLVPGSLRVSPLAFPDSYATPRDTPLSVPAPGLLANDTGSPAPTAAPFSGPTTAGGSVTVAADGGFSYTPPSGYTGLDSFSYSAGNSAGSDAATVAIAVELVATAADDSFTVSNGGKVSGDLLANDAGDPPLTALSFGDTLANVATIPADGATILSLPAGGGTIDVTLAASGAIAMTSVGTTGSGAVTLFYQMQASDGTTDAAQVTIAYGDFPVAVDDTNATLGAGAFTTTLNTPITIPAGTGLLANDSLGTPAATLTFFGGGAVSGAVDRPAGTTQSFGDGSLTVNADGSFSFTPVTGFTGVFTFQYAIENGIGSDTAAVEINVTEAPVAIADTFQLLLGTLDGANSVAANDDLGAPPATVSTFGGGDLGGVVTDNAAGATVAIPGSGGITVSVAANGALTVDATGGTAIPGGYSFDYRLTNAAGTSDATVTIAVQQSPLAEDDTFTMLVAATLSGDLTADNGGGADNAGVPAYSTLTFGGGSLGGTVTGNSAGSSVALAGGTLTVNLDGTFSLVNPTAPGSYTFLYRLGNAIPASDDATVTIEVRQAPVARDDANLVASVGTTTGFGAGALFGDNGSGADSLGTPEATLTNFGAGDIAGSTLVTDFAAGATTGAGTFAGGTLTVNADGSFSLSNPTQSGDFSFVYRIQNAAGLDDATVTVTIQEAPLAQPDTFVFQYTAEQAAPSGLFADNGAGPDALGNPAATLTTFGGGSLGGTVASNTAGASVPLAGGTLTVNANGTWSLTGQPFTPGSYSFDYEIDNGVGASTGTVTLTIQRNVVAVDDAPYAVTSGDTLTVVTADPNDLLDNDTLGFPAGAIISFGGGSLGGAVTDSAAGAAETPIAGFTDGSLTVGADGSFSFTPPTTPGRFCGDFTFAYRLDNGVSFDDGLVTVSVRCAPVARDDTLDSGFTSGAGGLSLSGDLNADNGTGADDLGSPSATLASFGGGSLGGAVTDNAAGASVPLAGGTLTVNADGAFSLADATSAGVFTFQYRLTNAAGSDDATVTIAIDAPPTVTTTNPANGATDVPPSSSIVVTFSEPVDVAAGGIAVECGAGAVDGTIGGSGTASVTFDPAASLPGNATCTVTVASAGVTDSDSNDPPDNLDGDGDGLAGGDDSFSFQVAPEAADDSYTVTPQLTFVSPAGVRANDNPADSSPITGFGATLGAANGTVPNGTNFITAGGAGGRVTLNADGTFTFLPDAGDSAPQTATFFYTIAGGDTAQVTLTFEAEELVWFVDGAPSATTCTGANAGAQACPAATLAVVAALDTANDTIFVADGTYIAGITLENGEKLVGDGASTTLATISGVSPVAGSSFPAFSGTPPLLNGAATAITLGSGNTLRGLNVGDATTVKVSGSGFGTLAVSEVTLSGTGQALALTTGTLSATFAAITSTSGANNISLTGVGGTLVINGGALSGATGASFSVSGGSVTATYSGDITQANSAALVSVSGGHGTGTLTFQSGTLSATSGTGIQLDNADGAYVFNGTTTLSGGDAGVDIVNGSGGNVTFGNGASITNPSGTAFNVSGGGGTVSYGGTISKNNAGRLADIQSRSGGSVTLAGNLSCLTPCTGINVSSNTGGTVAFSGTSKSLSTGANNAVTLASNTGATVNFTGGGLAITTSAGAGFSATGGGTVTVQGSSNTIVSTTGTALNIANTNIGASNVTFQSISANGAASGIVLNNTGAGGGLTVTGNGSSAVGGNNSGGTIQNTTSHGVSLTSTRSPSFTNLTIQNTAGSGIKGTQVTGFSFSNGTIANSGTGGSINESNIAFNTQATGTESNVSGSVTISSNSLTNARYHGVDIYNFSGTLSSVTISNNTVTSSTSSASSLGSALRLIAAGSSTTAASVTQATISANTISNFPSGSGIVAQGGNTAGSTPVTFGTPGSGTEVIRITGNAIAGASPANRIGESAPIGFVPYGILAAIDGAGQGNFEVSSHSTLANIAGTGIGVLALGSGTATATVTGNTVAPGNALGTNGILAAASTTGPATDTPSLTATISGNQVSQTDGNGILAVARDSNGTGRFKIQNNNVAAPLTGVRPGIRVDSGTANGNTTVCLNISGNASAGSGGHQGIGLRKQGTAPGTNAFGVNGMAATSSPGVETYVNGLNPAGNGTLLISAQSGFTNCSLPLHAAGGEGPGAAHITEAQLAPVAAEALARWRAAGISEEQAALLDAATFALADLPGARIGEAGQGAVTIDPDAAGWGWFVDPSPAGDAEFATLVAPTERRVTAASPAAGRMDLLTALLHELGHLLGEEDLPADAQGLMAGELPVGTRRTPAHPAQAAKQAANFPVSIGTLPAGKGITIVFDVTVADPLPAGVTELANQASVSGSGFGPVPSDDPATAALADPTVTRLGERTLFLPLLQRPGYPNLVVDSIAASGGTIQVTIRNQGTAPVREAFWVDLYINPSRPPTAVNQIWPTQGAQGLTWGVSGSALPIEPGASLMLSLGGPFYRADLSSFSGTLAAGTPLYAQVDSANSQSSYGGVLELHEATGGAYDNIRGPVPAGSSVTVAPRSQVAAEGDGLPPRPAARP